MEKVNGICIHKWEPLYIFKTTDGKRMLQQRCKKCGKTDYIELEENNQYGSKTEEGA